MQIINIKIKDLKEYDKNARTHPSKQIDLLIANIEKFGFTTPILVNEDNEIIAGHGRKIALSKMGKDEAPCVRIEGLSPEEVKALRLADNQIAQMSEWDMKLVIDELKDLSIEMLDLTGFDKDLILEPEDKDDEVPETPEEPQSVLGDLYELGNHRVLCGDSTKIEDVEKLMDGHKADMVFTDPPYGIDYSGGRTQVVETKTYGKLMNDKLQGDELGNLIGLVFSYNKTEADVYVCVSPIMQTPFLKFIENHGKIVDAVIVWDKKNAGLGYMAYRRQTEFILFIKGGGFKKGDKSDFDLWSISRDNGQEYKHGTQKPVAVSERAVLNSSKQDDLVLDLFLGSGSTLIASDKTGRICYGMELDPKYIDVIVQRYCEYTGNYQIKKNGIDITWQKI